MQILFQTFVLFCFFQKLQKLFFSPKFLAKHVVMLRLLTSIPEFHFKILVSIKRQNASDKCLLWASCSFGSFHSFSHISFIHPRLGTFDIFPSDMFFLFKDKSVLLLFVIIHILISIVFNVQNTSCCPCLFNIKEIWGHSLLLLLLLLLLLKI